MIGGDVQLTDIQPKAANADLCKVVWGSQEAEVVTGGKSSQPWQATGISMNINDIQPGDLFVASPQDDLDVVFKSGAACVMTDFGDGSHPNLPVLKVSGVYEALKGLARAARFRTHARVIAVQGKEAREEIQSILRLSGSVHAAGRHLSLSLAGLPDLVDYGVFGASPNVAPDVAVITDCEMAHRDTLFEMMPKHSAVLVHVEGEAAYSVISRAKAAGVEHIYTFSTGIKADATVDAQVVDMCEAQNGVRVVLSLMGAVEELVLPKGITFTPAMMAAFLTLKLSDKSVQAVTKRMKAMRAADLGPVSLIDPSMQSKEQAAFRITNMIDLGFGNQTAVLDNIAKDRVNAAQINTQRSSLSLKKGFVIPPRLANLNFVYTSKGMNTLSDAKAVIQKRHKGARVESITPDVLMPGDFLVFKDVWDESKAALSEALRIVPDGSSPKTREKTIEHAV
ncbi:MAG: hypothetical protein AAF182_02200 [Pseudomonadota bacterium]